MINVLYKHDAHCANNQRNITLTLTEIIGERIRSTRKRKGLTIEFVANTINSDVGNISRIENGKQGISLDLIEKISHALGIHPSNLFEEDFNNAPELDLVDIIVSVEDPQLRAIINDYYKGKLTSFDIKVLRDISRSLISKNKNTKNKEQ